MQLDNINPDHNTERRTMFTVIYRVTSPRVAIFSPCRILVFEETVAVI